MDDIIKDQLENFTLLVTEEDRIGKDISRMSKFYELSENEFNQGSLFIGAKVANDTFTISNFISSISSELSNIGESYILDIEALPKNIKEGISNGEYTIGESRQVKGNYRSVIVDKNGTRIKDITLKKEVKTPYIINSLMYLQNQIMLQRILSELGGLRELQEYHISFDRDNELKAPFFDARDKVLMAQRSDSLDEKRMLLNRAIEDLGKAINRIIIDKENIKNTIILNEEKLSIKNAYSKIKNIFIPGKNSNLMFKFLEEDMMLLTIFVEFKSKLSYILGDYETVNDLYKRYQEEMKEIFLNKSPRTNKTVGRLMHLKYEYTDKNRNFWYDFEEKIHSFLDDKKIISTLDDSNIYRIEEMEKNNG